MNKKLLSVLILCVLTFEPICWADTLLVGEIKPAIKNISQHDIKEIEIKMNTDDNSAQLIENFDYYYDTYNYITFHVIKYNNKYGLYRKGQYILEPIYDAFEILQKNIKDGANFGHDCSVIYLKVKKDNKWAIYSVAKNKFVTNFSYDSIEFIDGYFDLQVKLKKNGKFALFYIDDYNYPEKIHCSDFVYDDISQIINWNYPKILKVKKQDKWGLYLIDNDYYKFRGGSREISKIEYDDIKCEDDYQEAFNDYYIEKIKGKKNNSWKVMYSTKSLSKTWLDKALGSGRTGSWN